MIGRSMRLAVTQNTESVPVRPVPSSCQRIFQMLTRRWNEARIERAWGSGPVRCLGLSFRWDRLSALRRWPH